MTTDEVRTIIESSDKWLTAKSIAWRLKLSIRVVRRSCSKLREKDQVNHKYTNSTFFYKSKPTGVLIE